MVNNGAAALVLAATALAAGREIVLARGEMVEIGDGFRIPDLVVSTGARLREVGTTNRVTLADYAAAVGPETGFVLKLHPSNFVVSGFTAAVPAARAGRPWPRRWSSTSAPACWRRTPVLPDEPDAATALRAGAALVTASGDKLLGGPQAGLLLGRADVVERLRRHPLARALRVDKLTLAALEATLRGPAVPVARFLAADPVALRARAEPAGRPAAGARRRRDRGGQRGGGRRRRRARGGAAERGGEPAGGVRGRRCGPATPRCWAGSRAAAACSTCGRWTRPTTGRCSARSSPSTGLSRARRRDRRARRPRQVHPGPGADRDGAGPLGRGAAARDDPRPRLRLDPAAGPAARSRSSTCPGTSGSCRRCWPGSGRCRRCCSWSPPTAAGCRSPTEHLDALDALGVRHGLLAVTRADLADPGPALAAARERLARTSLGGGAGGRGQRGHRGRPGRAAGRRWTGLLGRAAGARRRTRRSGSGSTGRSRSGAAGRW